MTTVLVVDDEPLIAMALQAALEDENTSADRREWQAGPGAAG